MNNKITFPRLATMLADASGRSKRFSEDFLREFFSIISERLEAGESVKIKDLGTFRLSRVEPRKSVDVTTGKPMEISGHSKVVFIPSKEIAEEVNSPFEAFSSIEIGDDVDIDQLMTVEKIDALKSAEKDEDYDDDEYLSSEESVNTDNTVVSLNELANNYDKSEAYQNSEDAEKEEDHPEELEGLDELDDTSEPDEAMDSDIEETPDDVVETEQKIEHPDNEESDDFDDSVTEDAGISRKRNWVKGVLVCFVAAIVALFATFAVWYIFATNDFNKRFNRETPSMAKGATEGFTVGKSLESPMMDESEKNIISDTTEEDESESAGQEEVKNDLENDVPTAPSDVVVYDTISTTRYLTTMAKKHYGNYNLWPYIYEENKAKLGHPDRIRPGTPVVIPKLSKYGVDPNNASDIEKAKKLGVTIYAKYGKSI